MEMLATTSPTALRENDSGDIECLLADAGYSGELFIVFGNSVSYLPVRAELRLKGGEINHRIQIEYLRVVERNAWILKEIVIEFPEVEARVAASLRELPVVKRSVGRLLDVVPIQRAGRLEFELPDGVRVRDLVVEEGRHISRVNMETLPPRNSRRVFVLVFLNATAFAAAGGIIMWRRKMGRPR